MKLAFYEVKIMQFWLEVYESATEHLMLEKEVEFDSIEDAEIWARENYNTDCYACIVAE